MFRIQFYYYCNYANVIEILIIQNKKKGTSQLQEP